jgi:hypothetical protein
MRIVSRTEYVMGLYPRGGFRSFRNSTSAIAIASVSHPFALLAKSVGKEEGWVHPSRNRIKTRP